MAGDVEMANATDKVHDPNDYTPLLETNHCDAFAFSEAEQLALRLYDQLHELELERSVLEAQQSVRAPDVSALSDDALQEQLTRAQHEAMEAKAEYEIRNRITHNVLVMDPVRKAVHGAKSASALEHRSRGLLPLITESNTVSMVHGFQASRLASITGALSTAEQANINANRKNRELAQTMLALADELKTQSVQDIDDPKLRQEVDAVERSLAESRKRKRTLKGILSAMIVGSGINWAADTDLTELVMDDEEDG